MSHPPQQESRLLQEACSKIKSRKKLDDALKKRLIARFGKRFSNALDLVRSGRVVRYSFSPSQRTFWVVRGRAREYQVIPESAFCSCDDYYFRVMGKKRELCYHIIAQSIADSLGNFKKIRKPDREYDRIAEKWRTMKRLRYSKGQSRM
jgi:predicted nucleic acid-binding Zn finger protein